MMGVNLTAPPPILSPDKLPAFNIEDADLENLTAEKTFPQQESAHDEFRPVEPLVGPDPYPDKPQYDAVHTAWTEGTWEKEKPGSTAAFVRKWASAFGWDADTLSRVAGMPATLNAQFDNLYVAAPLLTV